MADDLYFSSTAEDVLEACLFLLELFSGEDTEILLLLWLGLFKLVVLALVFTYGRFRI